MKKETKENRLKDESEIQELKNLNWSYKVRINELNSEVIGLHQTIISLDRGLNKQQDYHNILIAEIEELKKVAGIKANNPTKNILLRILVAPLLALVTFIVSIYFMFTNAIGIIRYGGEIIIYEKGTIKNINDIYQLLKTKQHGNN